MGYNTQEGAFKQHIKPEYALGIPKELLNSSEAFNKNIQHLELIFKAEKIKCSIFSYYGQDYSNFHNKRRFQMYIIPRYVSCYVINKLIPSLTYEQIAGMFSFDRATAMNAIREVETRMSLEKAYQENVFKAEMFAIRNL